MFDNYWLLFIIRICRPVIRYQVEDSWKTLEFMVLPFKDYNDVFILGGTDDVQINLDESNINVQTIASSRHVGPIKPRVDEWVKQLELFGKTLVSYLGLFTFFHFLSRSQLSHIFPCCNHLVCWGKQRGPGNHMHSLFVSLKLKIKHF